MDIIRRAILAGLIGINCTVARGQPGETVFRSVEARVAQAHTVVRGSIANASGTFVPRANGYFGGYAEDGVTRRPDGVMKFKLVIKVDETLKGRATPGLELTAETFAGDNRFTEWAQAGTSFLWFINTPLSLKSESSALQWDTIRLGKAVPAEKNSAVQENAPPIFCMDLRVVTAPEQVLIRARAFAKTTNESMNFYRVKIPYVVAKQASPSFLSFVIVPVCPALETTAQHLITTPESLIAANDREFDGPSAQEELRTAGVDALQWFKSTANMELLKSLLKGVASEDRSELPRVPAKWSTVQTRAYEVLTEWGVQTPGSFRN